MADLNKIYLYRITHIANVPHILSHGVTHKNSVHANPAYTPIGDPSLIGTRGNHVLTNGNLLGDYIPFYFGTRTPMLYIMQRGFNGVAITHAQDVVYVVSSVQKIMDTNLPYVFTNGHAIDFATEELSAADIPQIEDLIDWDAVKALDWKKDTDLDLKRRKQAEFLVLGDIPESAVLGFMVYNAAAKQQLLNYGVDDKQIHINAKAYF